MMFCLPAILDQIQLTDNNYCPLNNTGFYDIDYDLIPLQNNSPYCPHTREICENQLIIDKTNIQIPTFLPTDSALWLDADDSSTITTVSGAVSEWRDKSGNNRYATQTTASNRPLLVSNGLNNTGVIRFNGTSQFLSCGDTLDLLNNSFESFIIVKSNSGTSRYFYAKSVAAVAVSRYALGFSGNSDLISLFNPDTATVPYNATYPSASFPFINFNIYSQRLTYNNLNELLLNTQVVGSAIISGWNNMDSNFRFLIGAYGNSNDTGQIAYLNGDISQLILFPRVLTQSEREEIEGYMAWSTGLQNNLPSNHPYKNSYPGVTVTSTTVCTDFYEFTQAP